MFVTKFDFYEIIRTFLITCWIMFILARLKRKKLYKWEGTECKVQSVSWLLKCISTDKCVYFDNICFSLGLKYLCPFIGMIMAAELSVSISTGWWRRSALLSAARSLSKLLTCIKLIHVISGQVFIESRDQHDTFYLV